MSDNSKKVVSIGIPDIDANVHKAFKVKCIGVECSLKDRVKWLILCDTLGLLDHISMQETDKNS